MKTLKNLLKQVVSISLIPLLVIGGLPLEINNVFAAEGDDVPPTVVTEDAPVHSKTLTSNGDGTYTIALSVTGSRESSETTSASKANVILVVDTSNSMNGSSGETNASGQPISRIAAEKDALTKDDGIIDKLLAQNVPGDSVRSDIIEVAVVNFGTEGHTAQTWTTNGTTLKNTINGLTTSTGTNWEGALQIAKDLADAKKQVQPNEDIYVIFLTDGEPTTDETRARNNHNVNTKYDEEWGYASDDARAIVSAGYTFYGLFTWGSSSNSSGFSQPPSAFLKSLVQYAYTGTGSYNSSLSSDYAEYYTNASSTTSLINALSQIVHNITTGVGYTNVELEDGVTAMTASSVKASAGGKVTGLKYYRSGGSYSSTANNGLGEEWTDAPEATINANNEVDWNLGDLVLENGVTYTVTFVVWPKQSSLDLVADLNNGIISYDSLTVSQKSQIKHIGDKYALKTNTDSPTLTYSTITTTTVDGVPTSVTSDPTTVDIENPDPVNLSEAKLALEKKWEDSLDPTQREEVGGEVTLNLLMDGKPYEIKVGDTLTDKILLTETSDWKIDPGISLAPGLMVAENSVAYDPNAPQVSYGGVTYAILEAGHEYTFEEKGINNHFELTSYIHHPMKIGNAVKDVFFSRDADGNITGIERIEDLDTLSATNTLKGGINIEKKVVDKDNKPVDTNDTFEIKVHLLDNEGEPYSYDYRIYYGEKNPEYESHKVYDAEGNLRFSRSDHIFGEGTLTETLYVGDTIRIVNVDAGVQYRVEETAKNGYEATPTITYKEAYGTEASGDATEAEEEGYYLVSGNTASSVTVTNKFLNETTKVDFKKTWYDADGNVLSGKTLPGSITVELFKKGADGKEVSTGETRTATAETDWKASFKDLPKYDNGATIVYSIKESAIDGATYNDELKAFFEFDSEQNNGKNAVVGKWTWKVKTLEDYILENTWTPATESVSGLTSFSIKKIDASTKKPLEGATFELKLSDGTTISKTTDKNGEATFDKLDAGEYSLKETVAPSDYQAILTEPTIVITKTKKLNQVDLANLNNIYEYIFSISAANVAGYTYDTNSRIYTVKNEAIPYIDVPASKVWKDGENRDGLRKNYANYYVAVRNNSGKYVAYEKLALEDKDDYSFEHLPTKTVNGEAITYEIVEASTCSGSGNSIQCTEFKGDKKYSVSIENGVITNTYEPEKKKLTIKKTWDVSAGTLPTSNPSFIMVELSNDQGDEPQTIRLEGTGYGEWTSDEISVYVYANQGKTVTYQATELGIDAANNLSKDNDYTLYIYNGEVLEGKWVATSDGLEVTNTWTPVNEKIVYEGADKFTIKKIDEDGEAMSGVTFTVNGKDKKTDKNGEIEVAVPISEDEKTDNIEIKVKEKETLDGYDLVDGSATIAVTCTSELTKKDETTLTNTYTKTCTFKKSGGSDYVWNNSEKTLVVTNNRSLAASLVIRKKISGVTAEALKNNGLKFTLTGPDDFKTQEISFDDFKEVSGGVYEYTVPGRIPTGEYKVVESGAEFDGSLTLTVTGDNNVAKDVEKDDEAEFEITNSYEKIRDVHYKVKKIWDDNDNQDGKRPEKLTITLMRKGSGKAESYRTVDLTDDKLEHEWTDLPRADENAVEYTYSVVEEDIADYDSDGGKMVGDVFTFTNKHEPVTKELTFKKVWNVSGDRLPSVAPTFIVVELLNDKNTDKQTIRLDGTGYGEWESDAIRVPVYANQGETITYSVKETSIGDTALGGDNKDTIYVYNGDVLEGKWVAENTDNLTVENTWTSTTDKIEYKGKSEFVLSKVDEDGKAMEGVTFTIGGKDYTTDGNGEITVKVPVSTDKMEESFEYKITEKETWDGYDIVSGSATVAVSCTSEFAKADKSTLVNTYTKNCEFSKKGSEDYVWNGTDLVLSVTNNRSLADSIVIRKKIEGLKASVLSGNGLTFTLSGPDDFKTQEISFNDFKEISEGVYEYTFDGRIPTGDYKVVESGAEVEYFTVEVSGDGEGQTIAKDDEAVFEIVNKYTSEKVSYGVVKIWDDAHDKDGKRPGELEIQLSADGEVVDTIYMSMADAVIIGEEDEEYSTGDVWVYVWEELPLADESAKLISYTVEEILESDDYEQTDMENDEYYMLFVNSHQLDDPCAEGGCGGDIIPPVTPETGWLTNVGGGASMDNTFVMVAFTLTSVILMAGGVVFAKRK